MQLLNAIENAIEKTFILIYKPIKYQSMATLGIQCYPPSKNGSVAISIRLSHNGDRKFFPTTTADTNSVKKGKIVDSKLRKEVNLRKAEYELRMSELDNIIGNLDIEQVYAYVFNGRGIGVAGSDMERLDFIEWYREVINIKKKNPGRTYETYKSSLNNFLEFLGKGSIDINKVNKSLLQRYLDWMDAKGMGARSREAYMTNHQAVYNMARDRFNDEDSGRIVVKLDPFRTLKFKMTRAEKDLAKAERGERCISKNAIRYLMEVPDHKTSMRANMARDVFMLSFCLCGVNACDLMEMDGLNRNGDVEFWRKKTRNRSGNASHVVIPVSDIIKPIMKKYRGRNRLFSFSEKYSTENNFNSALNAGFDFMVEWCIEYYSKEWGASREETIDKLEFPADLNIRLGFARHAFSTIARHKCGVSLDDIDQCLCHSVKSLAYREYIARDYSFVADVVNKVVGYTFGDED